LVRHHHWIVHYKRWWNKHVSLQTKVRHTDREGIIEAS
jgi:hypothetical protein